MRFVNLALLCLSVMLNTVGAKRLVMYWDQWHQDGSVDALQDVTHVILAFVNSGFFVGPYKSLDTTTTGQGFKWHKDMTTKIRQRWPDIKISIAIGGWGDNTLGFRQAVERTDSINNLAANIATVLDDQDWDGVDIDWEYPGGNGADCKSGEATAAVLQTEINQFPQLLQAISAAIGDKELTIAVPGKSVDMMAFTAKGSQLWDAVDHVNIMSYDLFNRRDTTANHHASFSGAKDTIQTYLGLGLAADKINIGIPFYAKWARLTDGCTNVDGLGCATTPMEDANGDDTSQSGAMTFEASNLLVPPATLPQATAGACGSKNGNMQCPAGYCCSADGWCGATSDHCGYGKNQPTFNGAKSPAQGPDLWASWRAAYASPVDDEGEGVTYLDTENSIFWTWDSPKYVQKKADELLNDLGLGGFMAWSFGEENMDTKASLEVMQAAVNDDGADDADATSAISVANPTSVVPVPTTAADNAGQTIAIPPPSYQVSSADAPAVPASSVVASSALVPSSLVKSVYSSAVGGQFAPLAPSAPSSSLAALVTDLPATKA